MPYYARHLGKALRARLEELLGAPHDEQVSLYEELAAMRLAALQAMVLAEPVLAGAAVDASTRALAVSVLREALDGVRDMCLAASRIEHDADDKVSLRVIDLFVSQVTRAIHRACPDEALAKRIEDEINRTVRVPSTGAIRPEVVGTDLTPDAVVLAMDEASASEACPGKEDGDEDEDA